MALKLVAACAALAFLCQPAAGAVVAAGVKGAVLADRTVILLIADPFATAIPTRLQGLGFFATDVRELPFGFVVIKAELPDGSRVEIDVNPDGVVTEVELESAGGSLPLDIINRFVASPFARYPELVAFVTVTRVHVGIDGSVEVEGFAADGERLEADFSRGGRLDRFNRGGLI